MFRIVAEVQTLNADDLLVKLFDTMKRMQDEGMLDQLPGAMKLPPFFKPEMLKNLPQEQKLRMLAEGINREKGRLLPLLQNLAGTKIGPLQLQDFQVTAYPEPGCEASLRADVLRVDTDRILDLLITEFLKEEDLPEILGEHYDEKLNMENIAFYMHGQSEDTREYLMLRMMSVEKTALMQKLTELAAAQDVKAVMKNMRFLMKENKA